MKVTLDDLTFEQMIAYETICERTRVLGHLLSERYKHTTPVFVGVLNGSFMFMADLLKEVALPCEVAFVKLASYHGGLASSRVITEQLGLSIPIAGRHVIVVEDIVDTGNTLLYLLEKLRAQKPASLTICSLLYKPDSLEHEIPELEYVGFEIENKFVVGYGLDYKQLGRNLKDIYQLIK